MFDVPRFRPIKIQTKGKPFWFKVRQGFKRRQWRMEDNFIYWSPTLRCSILVPAPFELDFASVPRVFWFALDPVGFLLFGAIPHDFGYRYGGLFIKELFSNEWSFKNMSRHEIDKIFEILVDEINEMSTMARIARYAVNVGGAKTWSKARKFGLSACEDYQIIGGL